MPHWWYWFAHWILGHPELSHIREDHAIAEDIIAGTGYLEMSGWCRSCDRRVYWKEDL